MPISSLPSPYGIGTLGKEAFAFVDFLKEARQSWWKILPVGPTSYGDSPYQSFSTYAGNPYFIDLEMLAEDGLLDREELDRDLHRAKERFASLSDHGAEGFFCVDPMMALVAAIEDDRNALMASGILPLKNAILRRKE